MKGINRFPKKGGFFAAPCFPSFFSVGFLQPVPPPFSLLKRAHLPRGLSHLPNLVFQARGNFEVLDACFLEPSRWVSPPGSTFQVKLKCLMFLSLFPGFSATHSPTLPPNLTAFILWHTNHLPACSCPRSKTPVIPDVFFVHRWMPFLHHLWPHGFTVLLLLKTLVLHLSTIPSQAGGRALFSVLLSAILLSPCLLKSHFPKT